MKKRILVIEDDLEVLNMVLDYLKVLGYEAVGAEDGLKGLKALRQDHFDAVVTDITMPYVSGIGIISIIKKDNPEIPVIAITGFGEEVETLAQEKHADAVLSKPFAMEQLKEILDRCLAKEA
ncbi:MAG: response regulator [Thermodesulfobacteria bacterium]|nr:response regulator [Thermodesulfobacteriota bacterium]